MIVIIHTPLVMAAFHVDDRRVGLLIFFYCSLFDANFVRKNKTLCESNDLAEFAFYLSVFFFFSLLVSKPSNIFLKLNESQICYQYFESKFNRKNMEENHSLIAFIFCRKEEFHKNSLCTLVYLLLMNTDWLGIYFVSFDFIQSSPHSIGAIWH